MAAVYRSRSSAACRNAVAQQRYDQVWKLHPHRLLRYDGGGREINLGQDGGSCLERDNQDLSQDSTSLDEGQCPSLVRVDLCRSARVGCRGR